MASVGVCQNSGAAIAPTGSRTFVLRGVSLSIIFSLALITACSEPSLRSVTVTPASGQTLLTAQGQTAQFHANATYQLGSHPPSVTDITATAAWTSSTPSVATVNAGLVTAVGTGIATITATETGSYGIVQGSSNVEVNLSSTPVTGLTSVSVVPSTQPITVLGQTAQFVAIGSYTGVTPPSQDLTQSVTWSSSAPGIATINSNGLATAISAGTATITATGRTSNGGAVVGTATLTVSSSSTAGGLTAISIIPTTQVVYSTGETSQYIAIGTFTGVTPVTQDITNSPNLKWISSDISVATINPSGLATETGFGTTAITAEWVQTGAATITGAATFTSQVNGPAIFPSLEVYKVGNGATTSTATITPSPLSTQPPFSCGTGTGCTGYYFPLGTTVTLTVTPVPSNFGGFTSNCTPVAGNPVMSCTVILNGNQAVGAIFN